MTTYTIRLAVSLLGKNTIVIALPEDYEVGQTVSVSPTAAMTVSDGQGGSVTMQPGVTMQGTVIAKN